MWNLFRLTLITMPTREMKAFRERDICLSFINPALVSAQWELMSETREDGADSLSRHLL